MRERPWSPARGRPNARGAKPQACGHVANKRQRETCETRTWRVRGAAPALRLPHLCCALLPFCAAQPCRKGFAFCLLRTSTNPSVGLSSSEDAVSEAYRSNRVICVNKTGGTPCWAFFALFLSGRASSRRTSLRLDCQRGSSVAAVPACGRNSPQRAGSAVRSLRTGREARRGLSRPKRGGGSFDVQRAETKWCRSLSALITEQQESIRAAAFLTLQRFFALQVMCFWTAVDLQLSASIPGCGLECISH